MTSDIEDRRLEELDQKAHGKEASCSEIGGQTKRNHSNSNDALASTRHESGCPSLPYKGTLFELILCLPWFVSFVFEKITMSPGARRRHENGRLGVQLMTAS